MAGSRAPHAAKRHAEDEEVAEDRDPGVTQLGRRHAPVPTKVGVDRAGAFGQPGHLGDGDGRGPELFGPLPVGEQAGLAPGEDDPRDARRDDVPDAGHRARGAGAAGHQRAVQGGVPQPRIGPQLTQGHLLGVVVVLLLAGEPGGQHLAVLADDDRPDGERRVRRRAQPGQLHRPAQEPVVRAAGAEQVAQQRDLADAVGLGEGHGASRGGGREVEARGGGVGDEERGHGRLSSSARPAARKSPRTPRAAFDQRDGHPVRPNLRA